MPSDEEIRRRIRRDNRSGCGGLGLFWGGIIGFFVMLALVGSCADRVFDTRSERCKVYTC